MMMKDFGQKHEFMLTMFANTIVSPNAPVDAAGLQTIVDELIAGISRAMLETGNATEEEILDEAVFRLGVAIKRISTESGQKAEEPLVAHLVEVVKLHARLNKAFDRLNTKFSNPKQLFSHFTNTDEVAFVKDIASRLSS